MLDMAGTIMFVVSEDKEWVAPLHFDCQVSRRRRDGARRKAKKERREAEADNLNNAGRRLNSTNARIERSCRAASKVGQGVVGGLLACLFQVDVHARALQFQVCYVYVLC